MKVPAEVRQAHAELSDANGRFLDYVQKHPELFERSSFEGLERLEARSDYPFQAWPTFISSEVVAEAQSWNRVLCHLVKVIPHRVFGSDVGRLSEFYRIEESFGRLLVAVFSNPRWVKETIGRGDFMLTEDGFKCMEYNLTTCIGCWECSWFTDEVLEMEPVRRFIEAEGLEVSRMHTLKSLMGYLVKRGIQRFASKEVNIVALTPPGDEADSPGQMQLLESMELESRAIEALLKGKVTCRLLRALPEELEKRNGQLFLREHRVHAVLEGSYGDAGEAVLSCWLKGTVDLYNSPASLIWNDKRNLAMLSELEDSSLLSDDERQVVKAHLPWTRRVATDRLHAEAAPPVTREEILRRREELVLKPSNLHSGQDVFLGRYCEPAAWEEVVDRAYDEGHWLVQELLDGQTFYYQGQDKNFFPSDLIWGLFLFGDKDGGFGLRLGPKNTEGPINAQAGATFGLTLTVKEN